MHVLLATFTVLAQTPAANDPATLNQAMIFIGGLTAVAIIGNQIMGAMLNFRKLKGQDPNITRDVEASDKKIKALEDDMKAMELRIEKRIGEHLGGIGVRLSNMENTLSRFSADFNRSLGRLEGKHSEE